MKMDHFLPLLKNNLRKSQKYSQPHNHDDVSSEEKVPHKGQETTSDGGSEKTVREESGVLGASFNLTKTIVGSGIISLPVAIKQSGFLCGIVLLVLMALITDYSIYILVCAGVRTGKVNFQEMTKEAFGRIGSIIVSTIQFIAPLAALVVYIIICGHSLSSVMSGIFFAVGQPPPQILVNEMFLKALIILFVALPLSMIRNIARLEKFSALGILFLLFLEAVVIYQMVILFCPVRCYDFSIHNSTLLPPPQPCCQSTISSWFVNYQLFSAMGLFATSYACQFNIFLIYNSLNKRTVRRFMISTNISIWTAFVLFTVLGGVGYLTFMNSTRGDLLTNYCKDDIVVSIARLIYAVMLTLTFPVQLCACREAIERELESVPKKWIDSIYLRISKGNLKQRLKFFLYCPWHHSLTRHVFLTLLLVGITSAVAIPVSNLEDFLSVSTSAVGLPLVFIIPSLLHLKLVKDKGAVAMALKISNIVLIIVGIGLIVLGTGVGIYQIVLDTAPTQTHPLYCRQNQAVIETCPIERFRNLSSSSVSSFWGCACEDLFTANHAHLCHNTSAAMGAAIAHNTTVQYIA
jgi:sodium-coupled neutral amino acid transporter 11